MFQNSKKVHDTSETLQKCKNFHNTVTHLGENLNNESQARRTIEAYQNEHKQQIQTDKLNAMEVKASNMNSVVSWLLFKFYLFLIIFSAFLFFNKKSILN